MVRSTLLLFALACTGALASHHPHYEKIVLNLHIRGIDAPKNQSGPGGVNVGDIGLAKTNATTTTSAHGVSPAPKPHNATQGTAGVSAPGHGHIGQCYYYNNADFEGWDIGSQKAPRVQDCCEICRNKQGCTTYSWSNFEGGTCWLKNGRPENAVYKQGVKSAELHPSNKPYLVALETNTDYEGGANDLSHVPGHWITDCVEPCLNDPTHKCNAFSWNGDNGGTCWLKHRRGQTKSSSVVSGIILRPHRP